MNWTQVATSGNKKPPKPPPAVTGSKAVISMNGVNIPIATGVTYSTTVNIPANVGTFFGGWTTQILPADPLNTWTPKVTKKMKQLLEFMRLLRKFDVVDNYDINDIQGMFPNYVKEYHKKGSANPKSHYLKYIKERDKKKVRAARY